MVVIQSGTESASQKRSIRHLKSHILNKISLFKTKNDSFFKSIRQQFAVFFTIKKGRKSHPVLIFYYN